MTSSNALGYIILLLLVFSILLWFAPWVTFWAIGVLFGYQIPMTWGTWLAFWTLKAFVFWSGTRFITS